MKCIDKPMKIKIVHVINSFEYGGAEAMLCNMLTRTDLSRFEPSVVALIDDLTVADPVRRAGIPLATMGMRPGVPDPRAVARLAAHLLRERPRVVQTWMDHSNLIGGLATRIATRAKLVWGVHHSLHVPGIAKRTTLMTVSVCAKLSNRLPDRVVCVSEHSKSLYIRNGFAPGPIEVIPNGFNTDAFRPDPAARLDIRNEIGVDPDATLVGLVARFDPVKDHPTFLRAAAILARRLPDVRFLLCGDKVDNQNASLTSLMDAMGLANRCHLLGPRRDVARVHAALDVASSSSVSEAFPLAIGEAMACGVPCVATDVGDTPLIVGEAGRIVPPRDPLALAEGWLDILTLDPNERRKLGLAARRRVCDLFDLGSVTRRYEALYDRLLGTSPQPIENGGRVTAESTPLPRQAARLG